jgi:hypothetical protein
MVTGAFHVIDAALALKFNAMNAASAIVLSDDCFFKNSFGKSPDDCRGWMPAAKQSPDYGTILNRSVIHFNFFVVAMPTFQTNVEKFFYIRLHFIFAECLARYLLCSKWLATLTKSTITNYVGTSK